MRIGVYPGSFSPPTVAHLAIAEAARHQCHLDRVALVLSRATLGKDDRTLLPLADRVAMLDRATHTRPWLSCEVTDRQLVADIAEGYDVVVLGADKWDQVVDPAWYGGSEARRDAAVARLPTVAVAPRAGFAVPVQRPGGGELVVLDIDPEHHEVSATAVREGRRHWLLPEAADLVDP